MNIDNEYLSVYLKEKRKEFSRRDTIDGEMYNLYHGDYTNPLPKEVVADDIHTGYATQFIDRVMGIFTQKAPMFHMEPTGVGDAAVARSTKVETFLNALFPAMQREAQRAIWQAVVQDTLLYGRGLSFMPPAEYIYWKDFPAREEDEEAGAYNERTEEWKRANHLPLAWRHVPALKEYPSEDDYGLAEICTVEERTARTLLSQYSDHEDKIKRICGDNLGRKMSFFKYANREELSYFIGGSRSEPEKLFALEHKCGLVPYVRIRGKESSSPRPEHQLKSLLYHMKPLIMYLERLLIQKGSAIRIWCWPTPVITRRLDSPTGNEESPLKTLDLAAGKTIELVEGETAGFLVWTGSPPDIDEQVATTQRFLDRMGLASVMYGTTAADASSGYAINTLIQAAQSLFGPIAEHLSDGYAQLGTLALKYIELLGQTIYVYKAPGKKGWLSLAPDDIRGYYHLEGRVKATLPQELPVNAQVALQLTAGDDPLMDRMWAATELLGVEDYDQHKLQMRIEKLEKSPQAEAWQVQKALEEAGMVLEQVQGPPPQGPIAPAMAQLLGQPGLAGPSMAPPGGVMGQATLPMAPGVGMPAMQTPQIPGPQAQVNAAEAQMTPVPPLPGGRRAGAARRPGGARKGQGRVP